MADQRPCVVSARRERRSWLLAGLFIAACECGSDPSITDTGGSGGASMDGGGSGPGGTDDTGGASEDDGGPGNVTLRRLNRSEYDHTIRDLLGADLKPARDFPGEDPSFGFDNIADVLSISPLQLELYERTAESLATLALELPVVDPVRQHFEAESVFQSVGSECCGGYWNIYSNGQVYNTVTLPADGQYTITARAYGQQAGPELPHMAFEVQGQLVAEFDVEAVADAPQNYEISVMLEAGARQIAVSFTNDFYDPDNNLDRNLLVDWFEVHGPFGVDDDDSVNELRARIVSCDPEQDGESECLAEIVQGFTSRAFRRPVTPFELSSFVDFLALAREQGGGFEDALRMVVQASLLSPHFLFRVELDPSDGAVHALSPYELASRLSYFIWGSMPDAELFDRAADGTLVDDDVLAAQVRRMLDDRKAVSLIEDFAGQWLAIRALDDVFKDTVAFPKFDEDLRSAMRRERELFFADLLERDRPLQELLTADYSFANSTLAEFYAIDGVGDDFERIELADTPRRGLLGQAGLLSVLSHPNATSPVRRGKWVLEKILCQTPPPPPGDIDITPIEPGGGKTMKEKLAKHREDPNCAGCHTLMDPIGLGLEHFDAIGDWRLLDEGQDIQADGELTDGVTFDGAIALSRLLAEDARFPACAVQQMLTYALGRGPQVGDGPYRQAIETKFADSGYGLRSLVQTIATSDIFRHRQGDMR